MRLEDFTCPEQIRDAATVASIFVFALLMCCCLFGALFWKVTGVLGQRALLVSYGLVQLLLLSLPIALLYNTPTAPLPSAIALMAVVICALKLHSYLATNFAMEAEHSASLFDASDSDHPAGVSRRSEGLLESDANQPQQKLPTNHSPMHQPAVPTAVSASETASAGGPAAPMPIRGNSRSARARRRRRKAPAGVHSVQEETPEPTPFATALPCSPVASPNVGTMTITDAATGKTQEIELPGAGDPSPTDPAAAPPPDHLFLYSAATVDGSDIAPHPRQESRQRRLQSARRWPANVTLGNFMYFLAAPTLVYEPSYPRTRRIRRRYITARLVEMAACSKSTRLSATTPGSFDDRQLHFHFPFGFLQLPFSTSL
jgi:hypothetical protein